MNRVEHLVNGQVTYTVIESTDKVVIKNRNMKLTFVYKEVPVLKRMDSSILDLEKQIELHALGLELFTVHLSNRYGTVEYLQGQQYMCIGNVLYILKPFVDIQIPTVNLSDELYSSTHKKEHQRFIHFLLSITEETSVMFTRDISKRLPINNKYTEMLESLTDWHLCEYTDRVTDITYTATHLIVTTAGEKIYMKVTDSQLEELLRGVTSDVVYPHLTKVDLYTRMLALANDIDDPSRKIVTIKALLEKGLTIDHALTNTSPHVDRVVRRAVPLVPTGHVLTDRVKETRLFDRVSTGDRDNEVDIYLQGRKATVKFDKISWYERTIKTAPEGSLVVPNCHYETTLPNDLIDTIDNLVVALEPNVRTAHVYTKIGVEESYWEYKVRLGKTTLRVIGDIR